MDISVNIANRPFKFETCILWIQIEGSLFDIRPSDFFLSNVEIYEGKKMYQKLPVF